MPLHHVEIWIAESGDRLDDWRWLLTALGYTRTATWPDGETWSDGGAYLTLTGSPNLTDDPHDRRRPGVNHLAFTVPDRGAADAIMAAGSAHGWTPLYHERFPHAGGPDHYAGWLENATGFKIEVVAADD
ncbi:VOC family protein [Microbacterium gorillae]|uniref:VOC family protein n=1 Tax=Microbacterium gorillae TaxID=1231063 RepID=UPI00059090CC|nr:VOC family protein [Microbacterium gorillae]